MSTTNASSAENRLIQFYPTNDRYEGWDSGDFTRKIGKLQKALGEIRIIAESKTRNDPMSANRALLSECYRIANIALSEEQ